MWNLIYDETDRKNQKIVSVFEADDKAVVATKYTLQQFQSEAELKSQAATLGLKIEDDEEVTEKEMTTDQAIADLRKRLSVLEAKLQ